MIGNKIRELREENNILLRQLAAQLDMDTAMLSKMERGERFFKKEDIVTLSEIFNQNSKDLLVLWLADKIVKTINTEDYPKEALQMALKSLESNKE
ncbi:helix-turn-helix domain-containing protein [Carboxylicivirga marina]|uniref:helix-turn-helix domain-containing protein n=1 Tax=Carboxylicivirga marina TaxID=2800988 RepID=UPI00259380AA|nr:helix-turn-helix transcriptional regulator [uncultured Carboxylicivirga sp.]